MLPGVVQIKAGAEAASDTLRFVMSSSVQSGNMIHSYAAVCHMHTRSSVKIIMQRC